MEGSKSKCLQIERGVGALPESRECEWVEALELKALDDPENRDTIVQELEAYADECNGSSMSSAARSAAERIAALTMLEILHDEF